MKNEKIKAGRKHEEEEKEERKKKKKEKGHNLS